MICPSPASFTVAAVLETVATTCPSLASATVAVSVEAAVLATDTGACPGKAGTVPFSLKSLELAPTKISTSVPSALTSTHSCDGTSQMLRSLLTTVKPTSKLSPAGIMVLLKPRSCRGGEPLPSERYSCVTSWPFTEPVLVIVTVMAYTASQSADAPPGVPGAEGITDADGYAGPMVKLLLRGR